MLDKLVSRSQRDWDFHLPFVMSAYRSTEHDGTGFTPCRLFLGREVVLPVDLVLNDCRLDDNTALSYLDYVDKIDGSMKATFSLVSYVTHRLVVSRGARYNLKVKATQFAPGSWV